MRPTRTAVLAVATLTALGSAACASEDATPAPVANGLETAPVEPGGDSDDGAPGDAAAVDAVAADVETVAIALESFYRGTPYPSSAAEVRDTLDDAGLTLMPGNSIGGYVYDADAVEFTLCVESESGAWATYDTAPMTLRENGATGGCPFG